jgi:predicted TIM-barrel fold metal-dependent hydrolase
MTTRVPRLLIPLTLLATSSLQAQQPRLFDVHVHLHDGAKSLEQYSAQAAADKMPVDGMAIMWFGGRHQAPQADPQAIRANNDAVLSWAVKNPRAVPVVTVHPYDGEAALAELQRVASRGAKVLKIHPHTQKFDAADARVLALVQRAGELGLIVLMDNAAILPGDCEKLFNLAIQAPKTRFIFAHLGAMNFRFWNILALARTAEGVFAENVHFDLSGIAVLAADSPLEEEFVWTLRNVGIEHVLFGSDYPQLSVKKTADALDRLGLTEAEKAAIRYENARKLFGLKSN